MRRIGRSRTQPDKRIGGIGLPLLVFGVIAVLTVLLGRIRGTWEKLPPDPCRRKDCYCEPFYNRLVIQPVNTYSNLGLILVGLVTALGVHPVVSREENSERMPGGIPIAYGLTLLAAGFGSMFYHASLSRAGEWTDLVGIYLYLSFLMLYNMWRVSGSHPIWLAAAYLAINLLLGIQMIVARELQQIAFGGLAAGAIALEALILLKKNPRVNQGWINQGYLAAALACFALGGMLWALGSRLLPCIPGKTFPPHAAWHLLAAAAAGFYYLYYRSERLALRPGI